MTTVKPAPSSDAKVFLDYFSLIKWHVRRAKISDDAVEDYAMTLMERFIQHGLLAQYDPSKASFRTFLSGFVTSYLRHFKSQDLKRVERYFWSADLTVGDKDNTLWLDLNGYSTTEDFENSELNIVIESIRKRLRDEDQTKLLLFLDIILLQVEEYGKVDVIELAELFDVTTSSIRNWRNKLSGYFEELR